MDKRLGFFLGLFLTGAILFVAIPFWEQLQWSSTLSIEVEGKWLPRFETKNPQRICAELNGTFETHTCDGRISVCRGVKFK